MADQASVEEVAESMLKAVTDAQGRKKLKPGDLTKMAIEQFGEERCDKQICKKAIRTLIDSGRCIYTYFGGSFVELPQADKADGSAGS